MIHIWDSVAGCISLMPNTSVHGTWIQEFPFSLRHEYPLRLCLRFFSFFFFLRSEQCQVVACIYWSIFLFGIIIAKITWHRNLDGLNFSLQIIDVIDWVYLQVTFIEALDQLMPGFDPEIGKLAQRVLINPRKIDYHTGVFATKVIRISYSCSCLFLLVMISTSFLLSFHKLLSSYFLLFTDHSS
jgi:hypothetical protein